MSYEIPEGYVLARIKPYNPRRGYLLRSYTWGGTRYRESDGWYAVDAATAAHLRTVNSRVGDVDSPLAFDICLPTEAESIEKAQKLAAQAKAPAAAPKVIKPRRVGQKATKAPEPEKEYTPLSRVTEEEEVAPEPTPEPEPTPAPVKPAKQTTRRVKRRKA